MTFRRFSRVVLIAGLVLPLAGCGGSTFGDSEARRAAGERQAAARDAALSADRDRRGGSTIWDLFSNADDPNTTVEVNKYIWQASLEVLNFLPVQSVDPFTGVISTGYGVPPGGGRAYRATVYVQDPALDARSLKVSLQTQGGGPVSAATQRAVEDAILTRARQLRLRDAKL